MRKIFAMILLPFILASCQAPVELTLFQGSEATGTSRGLPATVDDGAILHAYNWPFASIQSNLTQIAAAGYKAIQVSPIQGTKANTGQWWLMYQPTNFAIGNAQLGNQSQFEQLCTAANVFGIKIIVDAVVNHVADNGNDGQWANEVDPTLKRSDWYHNRGTISEYKDRQILTQGNLGNPPDLATQRSDVQQVILGFLNAAVNAGAGGFRFDAAKHIETDVGIDAGQPWAGNFWTTVLGGLNNKANLYLYGEVIQEIGDNLSAYTDLFDVTAHPYIWTLSDAVNNGNWNGIQNISGMIPSKALVYAENHDTYEHFETSGFSFWKRKAMWGVIAGRAGMTPLWFNRPNTSEYNEGDMVAINHFRNEMVGQGEFLRVPTNPMLIIERGTKGALIINNGPAVSLSTPTNLTAGNYTGKGLTTSAVTVAGGVMTGNIPANSIVVIYNTGVIPVPVTPAGLSATGGTGQISVSWNASTNATSYNLLRSTSSNGTFTALGTTTSTTYVDTALPPSTTYWYKISASNSSGTSALSSAVSGTTNPSATGLKLHFKVNSTANWSSANLYYWASNGSPVSNTWPGQGMTNEGSSWYGFTVPGSSSSNLIFNNGTIQTIDLARTIEGWFVPTGTTNGKITGTWYDSNPDTLTAPPTPTGVTGASASSSQINLTWTASTGATSYQIYRSTSSTGTYASVGTTANLNFSNTGLSPATAYYYKVTASNSIGASGYSAIVTATTQGGGSTTTTIRVSYDTGMGNNITIRGSVSPLSWTLGAATTWTTGNVWVYTTTAIPTGTAFEFKALINDNRWSDGANFTGIGGSTINVTPTYNGNFYDVMESISTNWGITGGTATYKWVQGPGYAQAQGTSTISYLTQKITMNKVGSAVTLAFKYKITGLDAGEYLKVQVLKGTTWTNVGTYTGTADWTNTSIDITAYQSSAMKLRFLSFMNAADELVYLDNVTVSVR